MKQTILAKLDERYDVALLPYSPVQERESVDIRCQIYNDREEETEYEVQFFLDGGMDGEAGFVQQMQAVRPYAEKS